MYNTVSNRNSPLLPNANGASTAASEVTEQQVEDQMKQLNRMSEQLRALPQSPAIEETAKGRQIQVPRYLSQEAPGVLPSTAPLMEVDYMKNINRNSLTGLNSLAKPMLSELVFGNPKSLGSLGGVSNLNNPIAENELPPESAQLQNTQISRFIDPMLERKLEAMRNPQLGNSDAGVLMVPFENTDVGDLPNSELEDLKGARHRAKHKSKRKGDRSDVVTRLLLTLLVDKLKDIYEMDKFNSAQKQRMRAHSSTVGRTGTFLRERNHPINNDGTIKNRFPKPSQSHSQANGYFTTNLSFPITFSDSKGIQLSLVGPTKRPDIHGTPPLDVDTKNIEKIINSMEKGDRRSTPSPTMLSKSMKMPFKGMRTDPGNRPQEISQKITKTLDNADINSGSVSEFHRMRAEPNGVLGKARDIASILDFHSVTDFPKPTEPSAGILEAHPEKTIVSTLPTYSISSLLNQEFPGSIQGGNRVLKVDSPKVATFSSTATQQKTAFIRKNDENDTSNYLEASRVLGAVFNKVKDPLARKSVETAIKAMLKLMKSNNTYSKKESVPSTEDSFNLRDKVKKLVTTIHKLSEILSNAKKKLPKKLKKHRLRKRSYNNRHGWSHHKLPL